MTGEIPSELGNLDDLEYLWLQENQLTGEVPAELGSLNSLRHLLLSHNQLIGPIPPELGNLDDLEYLYLSGNQLTGCIPYGLRDVPGNDFYELALPFCDCATGQAVADATDNPGLVDDCEALLSARDTLAGSATLNWSAGRPIAEWDGVTLEGTPQRVSQLFLVQRQLTGRVAPELGNLSSLESLNLNDNELTGEIPSELSGLADLQKLYLDDNLLSGPIPPELGNLANLQELDLRDNLLSGPHTT